MSAQKVFTWANTSDAAGLQVIARDIQNTVKAKYDDATWLTVGKPLNDKLREKSKEALTAYILHQTGYTDANDLYAFFLIDVEMCTCMETSRLVQASAAVQLFVQRCLLNLESDTGHHELNIKPSAFSSEDVEEWTTWRKNYRVWQAAVEVMLYPENWIVPELRPNKTPFFEHSKNCPTAERRYGRQCRGGVSWLSQVAAAGRASGNSWTVHRRRLGGGKPNDPCDRSHFHRPAHLF